MLVNMYGDDVRKTLADAVRRKRLALGWSVDVAAEHGDMSPTTWTRVEDGKTVRSLTYAGIERAFGWEPGSSDQVALGGDPRERHSIERIVQVDEDQAVQLARLLPAGTLRQLLEPEVVDDHLLRVLDAWPRMQQWQKNTVVGVLEQVIRQSPSTGDSSPKSGEIEDQRPTG